jgi:hypothetical protein
MFTWKDYYTVDQIRQDQMAEVEQARLVNSLEKRRETPFRRMAMTLLGVVGTWMVRWGDRLIGRCEEMARAGYRSTPQSNV